MASELDQHVCLFDPAIKWGDASVEDATDRDTWPVERDIKKLVLRDGQKATVFFATKLDPEQNAWVKEPPGEVESCNRAFRIAVRRVARSDGSSWQPASVDERGYFAMSKDELATFENVVIEEIGALIIQSARLPFGLKGSYMLRPSSLHVSGASDRARLCVELNAERSTLRQRRAAPTP